MKPTKITGLTMKEFKYSIRYVNRKVGRIVLTGFMLSLMTSQVNAAANGAFYRGAKFLGNCFVIYEHQQAINYVTADDKEVLISAVDHIISVAKKYGFTENEIREVIPYSANNLQVKFDRVNSRMSPRKIKKLYEAVDLCKELAVDLHKFEGG